MVAGAIYPQMTALRSQGRVRDFEPEPGLPIFTFWDLGSGDNSAGWLIQPGPLQVNLPAAVPPYFSLCINYSF